MLELNLLIKKCAREIFHLWAMAGLWQMGREFFSWLLVRFSACMFLSLDPNLILTSRFFFLCSFFFLNPLFKENFLTPFPLVFSNIKLLIVIVMLYSFPTPFCMLERRGQTIGTDVWPNVFPRFPHALRCFQSHLKTSANKMWT